MPRLVLLLFAVALLAPATTAQEATAIVGTVLGHDGQPLALAHAHLAAEDSSVAVSPDGRFGFVTDTTGLIALEVTGVDHRSHEIPLWIEEGDEDLEVTVRLAANPPAEQYDDLRIIGDFNAFSFGSGVPMEPRPDGTYAATFAAPADTFAYQLLGATGHGNSVNGTMYDRLVYDGGGDYRSVVDAEGDSVTVVFSPNAAVRGERAADVTFFDPAARVARIADVFAERDRLDDGLQAARQAEYERIEEEEGRTMVALDRDEHLAVRDLAVEETRAHAAMEAMTEAIRGETDPVVRGARLAAYFTVNGVPPADSTADAALAEEALATLPPDSPFWRPLLPDAVVRRTGHPERYVDYLDAVVESNPKPEVAASVLFQRLRQAVGEEDEAARRKAYAELVSRFPENMFARIAEAQYAPDRAIMEGKAVPAFAFESLDEPGVEISNESLLGSTYLLDFWATWCMPCIAELPEMTEVYEDFRDRGFTILSLSFDDEIGAIAPFREGKFAMPWLHGFVEGGFDSDVAESFGVVGIPKPILVGPEGTILATEGALRGDQLRVTLAEHLGEGDAVGDEASGTPD
jgi:thiol-disulfide isomerase/thioredoxin